MVKINLASLEQISMDKLIQKKEIQANEIAIIGIAGQFPKAEDIDAFWENLKEGLTCVQAFPEQRREDADKYVSNFVPKLFGKGYGIGSYLEDIDTFDYSFFKLSPSEANLMDPSQRLFLQTAYHAIEDAGYAGERIRGSHTGVYLGYNADALYAYRDIVKDAKEESLAMAVPGNLTSIIASRIAYLLDFKGPSLSVDTACSSSLVAVHLACQAIRSGDCHMALAGSVRLNLLPVKHDQKLGIESSDGITRTFDESSDGTGNGEGVCILMLKGLSDAIKDKDYIYGVIKGSAMNQDGSSVGITAPNVKAQEEVILKAWEHANIDPRTISYIEAHGTGTRLGDPIEIDALTRAFRKYTEDKHFCAIGSVKTNMGHLDNAAGMAGMAKATLALRAAMIPPHLHFKTPNTQIDFDNAPVYVETKLTKWEPQDMPRRCGVSAFGLSGTNCHIVMEEAPYVAPRQESGKASMVPLSAKSKEALQHLVEAYQNFAFDEGCVLRDIAYTASFGREHHKYRLGIVATDVAMLQEKLRSLTVPYVTDEVNGIFYGEVGQGTMDMKSEVVAEMTSSLRAAHYVSGQALEWQPDTGEDVRKTRIPCYPFEKKRCWVELPEIRKGEDQAEEASARTQVKEAQQSQGFTVKPLGKEDEDYTLLERHLTQIYGEVLGFEEINIEDDFFDLGGDSIIAMKIAKIIQDRLGIQAHMADLLECIGIAEYSAYLLENADCSKLMAKETEVPQEEASDEQVEIRCYPASSAQKRLFVTCQDEALSVTYNITNAIEIQGAMEVAKITEVFNALTKRHESLRTSFEIQDGEIMQIIHPTATFEVEHEVCAPTEVDEKIRSFVKGFDLTTYPLMRVKLLQLQEDKWILVFDASHLICDGYSVHLISSEFIRLYAGDKLGKLGVQYHDYTSDQEAFKQEEAYKGHQDYWQRKLGGDLQKLELPNDFQEITNQSKKGAIYRFTIPEAMMAKVNAFASEQGTTLYMVLLAVYKVMLSKYCQQEDIVVGTPIAGRNQGKFDGVVGMFVNTLAIRSLVTPDKCVSAFLSEVKQTMLEAYKHEAFQFEDVVACVDAHTRYDENPLFNTMFALQNLGGSGIELQGMSFTPYPIQQETSRFELMFNAIPKKQGLEVEVEYRTGRFKEATIKAMGDHFINLLNACIADASQTLGSISMVSPEALAQVHGEGWLHEKAYPLHKNLVQLIDEQVKKQPTALAVISGSERLTYEALDTCANQVAKYLQMQGVAKGDIVGIAQERSSGCIVSILGILKIGAVYLPIDTTYPQERVDYMLKDSGAKVLLTPACLQEALQVTLEDVCTYEDVASTDPAYVIYTSGSTGTPKGVVVSHRSVVNFIYSLKDQYEENVGKDDKFLALTNLCFDVSVSEIFTALCFGAALHFYQTGDFLDLQSIAQYMTEEGITYTYLPPAYLETMCELLGSQEKKVQLNKMLVGVEPIKDHVLDGYLALNPKMCIVNGYGPTEATICASFYVYKPSGQRERIVPIGKALANTNLYILDKSLQPVPQGVQGEICISGEGLALGYLGKPELSSEKFITNPFASGQRLYRTGDMGKFLEDGNVQFMGRQDHQVKIRGYRIELGEVEAKLSEVQGVKHAVVLDQVDAADVKYLCAYVVLSEAVELKTLRQQLKAKLPSYMIPSHFVLLETLPVTSNGKIDRKALVALGEGVQIEKNYVEPQTTTEKQLAALWEEVLETKPIGREDDFFELGGHSIKATRLAHQMKDTFNVQVPIRTIFDYPSVQQMADWLEKQEQVVVSEEQGVEEKELYQASTDQERMYIVQTLEPESTAYNMPVAFEVQGALDFGRVKEAFRYMINRHEALRTSFHRVDDVLMQKIHPISEVDLPISQIKCTQDEVTQVLKQFIQPFNLTDAPLLRVNVIALASEHFILALDMHHIISDGRTIEILAEEFTRLYSGEQ
ncbi:MAG: amino acid adenylation domain-containing protein, partial [Cellulosilyticaceae bacterium]